VGSFVFGLRGIERKRGSARSAIALARRGKRDVFPVAEDTTIVSEKKIAM